MARQIVICFCRAHIHEPRSQTAKVYRYGFWYSPAWGGFVGFHGLDINVYFYEVTGRVTEKYEVTKVHRNVVLSRVLQLQPVGQLDKGGQRQTTGSEWRRHQHCLSVNSMEAKVLIYFKRG